MSFIPLTEKNLGKKLDFGFVGSGVGSWTRIRYPGRGSADPDPH